MKLNETEIKIEDHRVKIVKDGEEGINTEEKEIKINIDLSAEINEVAKKINSLKNKIICLLFFGLVGTASILAFKVL